MQQNITNSQIQTRLEQRNTLPDWRVGVINQSIARENNYNVLHAGLSFHIFTNAQKAKIQSSKIQEQVNETQLASVKEQLNTELETMEIRQRNLAATLQYYEEHALPQADLIRQTALSTFKGGEIGYLEFFAAIQQAYQLQEEYLINVLDYDFNLIRIEEITGEDK